MINLHRHQLAGKSTVDADKCKALVVGANEDEGAGAEAEEDACDMIDESVGGPNDIVPAVFWPGFA